MTAVGIPVPVAVPSLAYRSAMRSQVCGVAVVTTTVDGPVGFCASSLASISLDPPVVSFAVRRDAASGRAWGGSEGGLVHLLHDRQVPLARAFATTGADRFGGRFPWTWSVEGYPELVDRLTLLAVRTVTRHLVGDHVVVLAMVTRVESSPAPARPLAYHDGAFRRVGGSPEADPAHTSRVIRHRHRGRRSTQ